MPARDLNAQNLDFLAGGGHLGAMMRAHDWAHSLLGEPAAWPQSLRSVVGLLLNSKFPMFVAWGPELAFLYNDPYAEILGSKHPQALGGRFRDIWAEIWTDISPLIDAALAGEATYREDLPLLMNRKGYDEQTWFTFSYSPVRDESGRVVGMFCACTETTATVLFRKRTAEERERLERMFEQAPGFMAMLRGPDHVFELTNPSYQRIVGDRNVLGRSVAEALPEAVEQGYLDLLDNVYRTGVAYSSTGAAYSVQTSPDEPAHTRYIDFVYQPVRGEDGRVEGIFVEGYDVTERLRAEAALRESERELHTLTDALPVLISYIDADRRYRFVNRLYEDWFPAKRQDMLGRRVAEVIGPAAYARISSYVDRALAGERLSFEQLMPYADTATRHIEVEYIPRPGAEGTIDGFYALVQDVSARKAAEAALSESELRFRNMADHAPAMIWVTDPDGICTYLNSRWYEFTGQAPGAGEGLGWLDAIHPDDRPIAREAFLSANAERRNYRVDFRLRRADGIYRWVIDAAAARFTETGEYLGYIGSVIDIEDRKEMEAALKRQVAEQAAERNRIWEMSRDLLAIMGFDGLLKAINPAWETTLGRDRETLLSMSFREQVHPDDHARVEEMMVRLLRGETVERFEDRLLHADGSWRWISWTLVPEGEVFYAVGRDVTDEKEAAAELETAQEALRQAQKMEAMGQLTGGVAHDFNNLLTPIVGALDLLQRRGLGGEREQRLIDGAAQSADRARILVQRLLAFARRQPLQPVPVDMAGLVSGMADLIASTTGPQIKVVVDVGANLPPANADPNQLEMAVLNLAVNARDAMPDGGTLRLSVEAVEIGRPHRSKLRPGRYLQLSVADTGSGMDEATIARAVEPFFSTKGIGKGTGLGLSMVHGLASQLHGALTIQSTPGLGTNVELWLPQGDELAPFPEAATEHPAPATERSTVLLIDDEDLVRLSTADMLTELGYDVVEASSAEEALRLINRGTNPDIIVTDHLMPGMSGTDLARLLKTERPSVKVIIVSGYAETLGVESDLPRLAKPFRSADLAASLAALV